MKPLQVVRLAVGAGPRQVYLLGTLIASIANSNGFDAHTVGDIRLASEELALLLVAAVEPNATLECAVGMDDGTLSVLLSTATRPAAGALDQQGYRWRALLAITDSLQVSRRNSVDANHFRTEVRFSRHRAAAPSSVRNLCVVKPRSISAR